MEICALQEHIVAFIKEWEKERNVIHTEQMAFNHIVEEVGELAHEFVSKDVRKNEYSDAKMNNAICDILVHLVDLARLRGLDVETLVINTIREDRERFREKNKKNSSGF